MAFKKTREDIDRLNREAWEKMISEPKSGLEFAEKAYKEAKRLEYTPGIANASLNIGWCYSYLSKSKKALEYLQQALDLFTQLDQVEGCMKSLNAIGVVYHNVSQYESAVEYYSKSLALAKNAENTIRELAATNNLGEIYHELGNYTESYNFFIKALELAEICNDRERLANVLVNLGLIHKERGDHKASKEQLERAMKACTEVYDQITLVKCHTAMGILHAEKKEYAEAITWLKKSIETSKKTENRHGELEALYHMAQLYTETEAFDSALSYLQQTIKLSSEIESKFYTCQCYLSMSQIYEGKGNYQEALDHYKRYNVIEKEIFSEQAKKRLENLITRHEIERASKEAEIYRLKNIEIEKALSRMKIVSEIGQKITASLDIENIMFTVYESVKKLMPADGFGIAVYEKESDEIDYRLFFENAKRLPREKMKLDPDKGFASWCIAHKKEVLINDKEKEYKNYLPLRPRPVGQPTESIIYIPLEIKNEITGVLTVQSFTKHAYTDFHLNILKALGSYLAIALENSIMYEELKQLNTLLVQDKKDLEEANRQIAYMANHDNLTGLPNRRLLYGLIEEIIAHSSRNKKEFALFYIDLDNFKPINDNYGHEVGDEVLKIVSDRLINLFRSSDTVARIGGDEFVIVIRDVEGKKAIEQVAEKTIHSLQAPIQVRGEQCSITMSLGIALYPDSGTTFRKLLKTADKAMYMAKESGKNQYLLL